MTDERPAGPPAEPGSSGRTALDPRRPLSAEFRTAIAAELGAFVDAQAPLLAAMGPELGPVLDLVRASLAGGKRLRPAFCVWSFLACGGRPDQLPAVLRVAASLELLHVSALVHDDLMDGSDLRRGQPAAHRRFDAMHRHSDWLGSPAAFGQAGAVLLGDLLLMWSVELAERSGAEPAALARALPLLQAMRTEVTCGQYLDVVAQAQPLRAEPGAIGQALDEASRVVEYKSARYTVQRPCQIGAALAGPDPARLQALARYGSPLGRAFQYRDDVLGVFGDPDRTGKPAGDDLREGKRTVLVAHALAGADPAGRALLARRLGDPALDLAGVEALRQVIVASGAREQVEAMIEAGHAQAVQALEGTDLTPAGRTALVALAGLAARREA